MERPVGVDFHFSAKSECFRHVSTEKVRKRKKGKKEEKEKKEEKKRKEKERRRRTLFERRARRTARADARSAKNFWAFFG